MLYPYEHNEKWGSTRTHEEVKDLYESMFASGLANASGVYSVFPASRGDGDPKAPADIGHYRVETEIGGSLVLGTLFTVANPIGRFGASEPGVLGEGCDSRTLSTASRTSGAHKCRVATNSGFFDPSGNAMTRGTCYGNFVSGGVPVRAPGTQNANFGLLKNGSFVAGYIPIDMVAHKREGGEIASDFETLVSGVVMLVKDGVNFVTTSGTLEDPGTQTTGSMNRFITVNTARTAIGHDKNGKLLLFVVDGATSGSIRRGIDLYTLADLMIQLGAINAINLDGGGSSTAVQNSQCINMPTDPCTGPVPEDLFHCERAVSTIVCVSDPETPPEPEIIPESPPPLQTPSPVPIETPQPSSIPNEPIQSNPTSNPETHPISEPLEAPQTKTPISPPLAHPVNQVPFEGGTVPYSLPSSWKAVIAICITVAVLSLVLLVLFVFFGRNKNPMPYKPLDTLDM